MKVKELIMALNALDQEADVLVKGWQGGWDNIQVVEERNYLKNVWPEHDYFGAHADLEALVPAIIPEPEKANGVFLY